VFVEGGALAPLSSELELAVSLTAGLLVESLTLPVLVVPASEPEVVVVAIAEGLGWMLPVTEPVSGDVVLLSTTFADVGPVSTMRSAVVVVA